MQGYDEKQRATLSRNAQTTLNILTDLAKDK